MRERMEIIQEETSLKLSKRHYAIFKLSSSIPFYFQIEFNLWKRIHKIVVHTALMLGGHCPSTIPCPLREVTTNQTGWSTCPNHTTFLFVQLLLV